MISEDTDNATSLQESAAGLLPSSGQDGAIDQSGREAVPVSRFRAQESEKALPTNVTSGPLFNLSSPSAALQWSLESRLRQRMAGNGSPLYALTWSNWDMPAGPQICRQRASARRTSGSDCTGWLTPKTNDHQGGMMNRALNQKGHGFMNLKDQALLAGWATPTSRDHKDGAANLENVPVDSLLGREVLLAGWETPKATNIARSKEWRKNAIQLSPLEAFGDMPNTLNAPTEKRGQLNPDFTRWLMGLPEEWGNCAPTATPSSRK